MRGNLYLVRHGESMGNVWKEAYKAEEKNFLTPYGARQAEMTGAYFKRMGISFNTVVSSNKTRARHTMCIILHETNDWQRQWTVMDGLNELNHEEDPARVYGSMEKIFSNWVEGDLLIVSHYHVMRSIFKWLGVTEEKIDSHKGYHIGNAAVFRYTPGVDRIELMDQTRTGTQF